MVMGILARLIDEGWAVELERDEGHCSVDMIAQHPSDRPFVVEAKIKNASHGIGQLVVASLDWPGATLVLLIPEMLRTPPIVYAVDQIGAELWVVEGPSPADSYDDWSQMRRRVVRAV